MDISENNQEGHAVMATVVDPRLAVAAVAAVALPGHITERARPFLRAPAPHCTVSTDHLVVNDLVNVFYF